MDIDRLISLTVLSAILYSWVQTVDVGRFDSALCNNTTRKAFLEQVLLGAKPPENDHRGNLFYHRTFSHVSLRFAKDYSSHENSLCYWSHLKLIWIRRRFIQITWLEILDIDLGGAINSQIHLLELQHVSFLRVVERDPLFCDLQGHKVDELLNLTRYDVNCFVQESSLRKKYSNLSILINSCPKLISLSVANSLGLSCDSFMKIDKAICKQLIQLNLHIRPDSTSSLTALVDFLADNCWHLVMLDISALELDWLLAPINYDLLIGAFVRLIKSNPCLEAYKVHSSANLVTRSMTALINFCPKICFISCNVNKDDMVLFQLPLVIASLLNNCKRLVKLEVKGCSQYIVIYSKWEYSLYLHCGCKELSYSNVVKLFELIKLPLFSKIDLWGLQSIDMVLFEIIGARQSNIVQFTGVECGFIFDDALKTVILILEKLCGHKVHFNHIYPNLYNNQQPFDIHRRIFTNQFIAEKEKNIDQHDVFCVI
jgi:hypothetical protein